MKRIINSIISVILVISMVLCTNLTDTNAQEKSHNLSKGQYLIINSKTNKLGYFKDGVLVKEFSVATGKASTPTPKGKFKIVNKIKNRPYYSGGIPGGSPKNPLGDRWLGLHIGVTYGTTYAIHGNNNASSIGKNVSGGCIRMHNSDIRWLFEQVNVGAAYAIIDSANKTFAQIAAKYGINLENPTGESQNIKKLKNAYKEFSSYNGIDLLSTNSIITNISDTDSILASKYNYINIYSKLNSSEKNNNEVKEINTNFNKIIDIVEFAQASIRFYNNISLNAEYIAQDIDWVRRLNTYDSDEFGTRGKALREYNDTIAFENKGNSQRVSYLDKIYTESVYFLNVIQYIYKGEINNAKSTAKLITDDRLNYIANTEIKKQSDIIYHWAESNINKAMEDGWIDTTNTFRPNDSITRAEFIKIINRKFNFTDVGDIIFTDIDKEDWYYEEVQKAVKVGYIKGNGENAFNPNSPITREEVAVIITSIMNNKQEHLEKIFWYKDFDMISSWATSSLEGAVSNGYIGVLDTHIRPKDNVTRAESVVILQRIK